MLKIRVTNWLCRGLPCLVLAVPHRGGFHNHPFIDFPLVALRMFTCVSSNLIKGNNREGGSWKAGAGNKPLECGSLQNLLLIYFDNGAIKRSLFTTNSEGQCYWNLSPLSVAQVLLLWVLVVLKLIPQNPLCRHCRPIQIWFMLIHCNSVIKFNCCEADLNRLTSSCAGICTGLNEIHLKSTPLAKPIKP